MKAMAGLPLTNHGQRSHGSVSRIGGFLVALTLLTACAQPAGRGIESTSGTSSNVSGSQIGSVGVLGALGHQPRVLVAGDSLAGGFFASTRDKSFVSLLVSGIDSRSASRTQLVFASMFPRREGEPVGIRQYVPEKIEPKVDLAIIELGTNDSNRLSISEFTREYGRYLTSVRLKNPHSRIVCLGVWGRSPTFDEEIERECARVGGSFIDLLPVYSDSSNRGPAGTTTEEGVSDEFHPNDRGHAAIAHLILDDVAR